MNTIKHSNKVAVETKYLCPTNTKGARIKAFANGHSATISYPYDLSGMHCHAEAVKVLCKKLGWHGDMLSGATKTGYVFVFCD